MVTLGWLFITTLLLYLVAAFLQWGTTSGPPRLLKQVGTVAYEWARHAGRSFIGPRGYLVFVTLVAAYVGLYSILEARYERRANRALFERSTFMTMVTSGNRATFVTAMKTFGPVQTMTVPRDPELWAPWTWFEQEKPNEDPLYLWAASFFPLCTAEACGNPDAQPKPWRIDLMKADLVESHLWNINLREAYLYNANLRGAMLADADLRGADLTVAILSEADLSNADLRGATLGGAWLRGADLTQAKFNGADLTLRQPLLRGIDIFMPHSRLGRGADFTGATLDETRLQGVDLREVFGLTQGQLDTACVDDRTQLPDGLTRPAPCQLRRPAQGHK